MATLAFFTELSTEMRYLALSILLLMAQIGLQAQLFKVQVGNRYTAGPRDEWLPPAGAAGRADRALRNFLETFPAFAALVLALQLTHRGDWLSGFGAALYFWARVAYLPAYLAGQRGEMPG